MPTTMDQWRILGRLSGYAHLLLSVVIFLSCTLTAGAQSCGLQGVAAQVLGSGGPELQDKRASSSYLVWENGRARVLVDAGGGSALRFGESGAQMSQLDVILFSHFHVDHSGDFSALVKSSWFEDRKRDLPIYARREMTLCPPPPSSCPIFSPEGAVGVERRLHMPPSVIGQIAGEAHVKQLVLSHRMLRTLGEEKRKQTEAEIKKQFSGPMTFANDLDCFPLK